MSSARMDQFVNSYLLARAGTIKCHDCSCHVSPPCHGCVSCETCNPCWECDEIHDAPRNDACQRGIHHVDH